MGLRPRGSVESAPDRGVHLRRRFWCISPIVRRLEEQSTRSSGVRLTRLVARVDAGFDTRFDGFDGKLDDFHEQQAEARERLARLETEGLWPEGRRR